MKQMPWFCPDFNAFVQLLDSNILLRLLIETEFELGAGAVMAGVTIVGDVVRRAE